MNLPSKIQFADEKVKEAVEELKKYDKDEKGLYRYLSDAFREIEENASAVFKFQKGLFLLFILKSITSVIFGNTIYQMLGDCFIL